MKNRTSGSTARALVVLLTATCSAVGAFQIAAQEAVDSVVSLPALQDAGTVARDICLKRGDESLNCIRLERIKIQDEIVRQVDVQVAERIAAAKEQSRVAKAESVLAREDSAAARERTAAAEAARVCIERLIAGNKDGSLPKAIVMETEPVLASSDKKVTTANACAAEDAARRVMAARASAAPNGLRK